MAESEEKVNSLWIKVKEESGKAGLKLNITKTKVMAYGPSLHGKSMEKASFNFMAAVTICSDFVAPQNKA